MFAGLVSWRFYTHGIRASVLEWRLKRELTVEPTVKAIVKALIKIPIVRGLMFTLGGLLLGYIAVINLSEQVRYTLDGQPTTAQVDNSHSGKRGTGTVVLTYEAEGQSVKARMSTWFYSPQPGEQIPILYRPDAPQFVQLDSLWRRFLWPVVGTVIFGTMFLVGLWELYAAFGSGDWRNAFRPREYEAPLSDQGMPVEPSGIPLRLETPPKPGATVLSFSQGRWWRAEVVSVQDDLVKIHYPGWDSKWDVSVRLTELQVDTGRQEKGTS